MNINDLTLGQIKELQQMLGLGNSSVQQLEQKTQYDKFVGKFVLVRHNLHGVNCGILTNPTKEGFYLENGRKFWKWQANTGVALESFACDPRENGTKATHVSKCQMIPTEGLCGIILVSDQVREKLMSFHVCEQS